MAFSGLFVDLIPIIPSPIGAYHYSLQLASYWVSFA
jgi:hypothetical protein